MGGLTRRGRAAAAMIAAATTMVALGACASTVTGIPVAGPVAPTVGSTASTASTAELPVTTSTSSRTTSRTSSVTSSEPVTTGTTARTSWQLPAAVTKAQRNKFGDVLAEPGRVYSLVWSDDKLESVAFVVDGIAIDKGCKAGTDKPVNGHLLVISLRVEIRNATAKELSDANVGFTAGNWTAYDSKGTAQVDADSNAASSCSAGRSIPFTNDLRAGKVNSGLIALDVSDTKGTVVLAIHGIKSGWEYSYG